VYARAAKAYDHFGTSIADIRRFARENEMGQQWQFNQDDHEQWHWTRVEENCEPTQSAMTFSTALDCYLDAVRHAVDSRRPGAKAAASATAAPLALVEPQPH
jgi:hypothetical protein